MRHPRKALVAGTVAVGRQYAEALQLNLAEWDVFHLGQAVQGRQFDRVVILRPHWDFPVQNIEDEIGRWRCRCAIDAYFKII